MKRINQIVLLSVIAMMLLSCDKKDEEDSLIVPSGRFSESFDLRNEGFLTPSKDQGSYGTCWAFATVGLVEYYIYKSQNLELDLSEQNLVNCAGFGPFDGLDYFQNHGVVEETVLAYNGNVMACNEFQEDLYSIESYSFIRLQDLAPNQKLDTIKYALTNHGVVLSHMDGLPSFGYYQSGVYSPDDNELASVGHIILIVGWRDDSSIGNGGYWICKNSYGENWGENGYFSIEYQKADIANAYAVFIP